MDFGERRAEDYDFEKLLCGTVKYRDKLYVVYAVSRKGAAPKPQKEPENDDGPYYQSQTTRSGDGQE